MANDSVGRGRPTKYDPKYCDQVQAALAEGMSLTAFAAAIDVARSTINQWIADYPDFSEACARAKAKSGAWWETRARHLAETGEGNAALITLGLKNMAADDWRDATKVDHTSSDGSMTPKAGLALDVAALSDAALAEVMGAIDAAKPRDN